jgi:hypothetical protein
VTAGRDTGSGLVQNLNSTIHSFQPDRMIPPMLSGLSRWIKLGSRTAKMSASTAATWITAHSITAPVRCASSAAVKLESEAELDGGDRIMARRAVNGFDHLIRIE